MAWTARLRASVASSGSMQLSAAVLSVLLCGGLAAFAYSTQVKTSDILAPTVNLQAWGLLTALVGLMAIVSLPKFSKPTTPVSGKSRLSLEGPTCLMVTSPFANPAAAPKPQPSLARMALRNSMQSAGPLDHLLPPQDSNRASIELDSSTGPTPRTSNDSSPPFTPRSSGSGFFQIQAVWSVPSSIRSSFSQSGASYLEARQASMAGVLEPSGPLTQTLEWLLSGVVTQMVVGTVIIVASLPVLASVSPWLCLAYPVVGVSPMFMNWALHKIKDGWIVPDETRKKYNSKFTQNVPLLSFFNIALTASQGMLFIYWGIASGQISMSIIPQDNTIIQALFRITWQTIWMLFAADVANYVFHRAAHENKWLYRHLHYLHHEHNHVEHALFSLFYVHPVEMFISNVCFFNGIYWFKTDMFMMMFYGTISSVIVCAGHSGLKLPTWADKLLDPSFHHLHHSRYKCNYSEHFTFTDKFFNTYVSWETLAQKKLKQ